MQEFSTLLRIVEFRDHLTFRDLWSLAQTCVKLRELVDGGNESIWHKKWFLRYHSSLGSIPLHNFSSPKQLSLYRSFFDEYERLKSCSGRYREVSAFSQLVRLKEGFLRRLNEEARWEGVRKKLDNGLCLHFESAIFKMDGKREGRIPRTDIHLRVVVFLKDKEVPLELEFNYQKQPLHGEIEERAVFGSNYSGEIFAYHCCGEFPAMDLNEVGLRRMNALLLGEDMVYGSSIKPRTWLVELLGLTSFSSLLDWEMDEGCIHGSVPGSETIRWRHRPSSPITRSYPPREWFSLVDE